MEDIIIGYGRTADVIACDNERVLKLYKPFMEDAAVDREYRLASLAYREGLPTPEPVELTAREGRKGIVYERVAGVSFLKAIADEPFRMKALAKTMAALHCRINDVAYDDAECAQKKLIERSIAGAQGIDEGDKGLIVAYLRSLPDGKRLCHGDFHPDNVLMGDKPWIIDWMTGSSGNPVGDIARSKMILETSEIPGPMPAAMRFLLKLGVRKLVKVYVAEYCKISKTKRKDIDAWLLPIYAARLVEHLSEPETRKVLALIRKEMKKRKLMRAS